MFHFNTIHLPILFSFNLAFRLCSAVSDFPLLFLVSLDGLRYDFVSRNLTPNIWKLAEAGVFVPQGIKSQVSTETSPNHQSIATGLYQESHGIIGNEFYDPVYNELFDNWNLSGNGTVAAKSLQAKWFQNGGEPIWRTNMRQKGRLSGSMLWPLADAEYVDKFPETHKFKAWKNYNNFSIWLSEIDQLIDWFTDPVKPINFGLYYNAEPDHAMHNNDIYSANVTQKIEEVDNVVGYLVERLKAVNLFDRVNLILTSDHGHANIPDKDHLFNLSRYLDFENLVIRSGLTLFPNTTGSNVTAEDIMQNLTRAMNDGLHLKAFLKEDIPEKYHYKHNRRIGPVALFYNLHYWDVGAYHPDRPPRPLPRGGHGFLNDHKEMWSFLVAHGPAFKKGYRVSGDYIQNIDLYPLMCHILNLTPAPNNGSLVRIGEVLLESPLVAKMASISTPSSATVAKSPPGYQKS